MEGIRLDITHTAISKTSYYRTTLTILNGNQLIIFHFSITHQINFSISYLLSKPQSRDRNLLELTSSTEKLFIILIPNQINLVSASRFICHLYNQVFNILKKLRIKRQSR
ncbi:hypothetical protein TTHERM_01005200 (macronuclear) [Tetrahymena thermophila SB210]|uniref:Uncharacterized protein n=1 Tax=Tetrahymena thermophila (strain SB210) TaxID=312017 RepID=Q22XS6_TETTS|nr:hypothetical protein TTHERM_01005200 [Tetrahymena thermophila SB210]EAR90095.1 hypothetical protein TTHERM_01005200 [Tetrahymena thermophila SB210]|eukprot:XP_001010340.1 hypothetical protein TTHERM_01005200 [Tetrahymena thermophila SB210]